MFLSERNLKRLYILKNHLSENVSTHTSVEFQFCSSSNPLFSHFPRKDNRTSFSRQSINEGPQFMRVQSDYSGQDSPHLSLNRQHLLDENQSMSTEASNSNSNSNSNDQYILEKDLNKKSAKIHGEKSIKKNSTDPNAHNLSQNIIVNDRSNYKVKGRKTIKVNSPKMEVFQVFPEMDILESSKAYLIKFAMPGVNAKGIHVSVRKNRMIIKGNRKPQASFFVNKGVGCDFDVKRNDALVYHRRELVQTPYVFSWKIPPNCRENEILAEFADGVLQVLVPKQADQEEKYLLHA